MKAVLVMDIPGSCMGCNFLACDGNTNLDSCMAREIARPIDLEKEDKPDWCPLRPVPEKKPEYLSINSKKGYCDGWNACIDKIMEGAK